MKLKIKHLTLTLFVFFSAIQLTDAQKEEVTLNLTLDQAIDVAYTQSIFSFRQKNMYLARYWQFRSYKAEKLPKLGLSSTLFNYRKGITTEFDNGEYIFNASERINSDATVDLSQNITATGATVSVSSELFRMNDIERQNITYSSVPVTIGVVQPIGRFNEFKWRSKIEPLKFEQAKREYLQSLQELSERTTDVFFNLVKAEINLNIAKNNVSNADTLYRVGTGRFEIGTVTQDELLDLELEYLNSTLALSRAKVNLEQARSTINSFLGFEENIKIECVIPDQIPSFKIKLNEAMEMAIENNPDILNFQQQLVEADRSIAQAKGSNGVNAQVRGSFGYNKNSDYFEEVYQSPFGDDKGLSLSLGVPIIDWGKRKGEIQVARSEKKVVEAEVRQGRIDFEQGIFLQVMEFNMQEKQVVIAAKADTIAQRGYEVTKQRFLIDKVDVIKLNAARNSMDAAKRGYVQNIQNYWINYFNIRELTLFDFETNQSLIKELDDLLQK